MRCPMEDNLKEKRSCLAKADAKMVVAIIVLALAVVLFICNVINVAETMSEYYEIYEEYKDSLTPELYKEYQKELRQLQIPYAMLLMKHITNIAIASLIVGIFAKKRNEIAKEIKSRTTITLEANTIPCPKCGAEIDRDETSSTLICPECGAKYKNPFYKG